QQFDVAGNPSAVFDLGAVTVDQTVPDAPSAALAQDTGAASDQITSNGLVNVSALESGATWQYSTDGGSTWTAGSGTSFTLAEGVYSDVQVQQFDVAGNPSAVFDLGAVTVDQTVPDAPSAALAQDTGAASDQITSNGLVNVSALESGATWQYSTDGGSTWTAGSGTSFTLA